jgi:hypothetical protein
MLGALTALLATGSGRARADASNGGLSCPQGLIVRLYTPQSPEATPLRMSNGVQVGASEPLLTLTPSMVKEARVLTFGVKAAPEDRQRYRIPYAVYNVHLELSSEGRSRIRKAVSKDSIELLVVCNGVVMLAFSIGTPPEAIGVLLDEHSPQAAAEQFAHSFTSNVRFEHRTPTPEEAHH